MSIYTYLRSRVDSELKLGLLSVIDREALHQERSEPGAGSTTERVEDQEPLENKSYTLVYI